MTMNQQKRHWISTVWPKHIGLDELDSEAEIIGAYQKFWAELRLAPGLRYACGQIEQSDTGALHIQAYTEWAQSKRLKEVYKIFPSNLEFRRGSRDDARKYCTKTDSRVEGLPEIGKWRKEKATQPSQKNRALAYLRQGMNPSEICAVDPECYFTHYRAIIAVYTSTLVKPLLASGEEE